MDKKNPSTKERTNLKQEIQKSRNDETGDIDIQSADGDIINSLTKSKVYKQNWNTFVDAFHTTLTQVEKSDIITQAERAKVAGLRHHLLETIPPLIPDLKKAIGANGSVFYMAKVITAGLIDTIETSLTTVRRVLELYEREFGAIYPNRLGDKATSKASLDSRSSNVIHLTTTSFDEGKDGMVKIFSASLDLLNSSKFKELDLYLSAKNKLKGISLFSLDDEEPAVTLEE